MSRSGQDAGRPPLASIAAGSSRPAAQVSRASTMARLQAWNKRQVQLLERKAERQAQSLERQARQQARRLAVQAKLNLQAQSWATDGQLAAGALSRRADGGLAGYPADGRRR